MFVTDVVSVILCHRVWLLRRDACRMRLPATGHYCDDDDDECKNDELDQLTGVHREQFTNLHVLLSRFLR